MMQRMLGGCWCALLVAACSGGPGPYQTPPGEDPGTPSVSDDKPDYADDGASYSDDLPQSAPPPNAEDAPGSGGTDPPSDENDCDQLCNLSDGVGCTEPRCMDECVEVLDGRCGTEAIALSFCGLDRLRSCNLESLDAAVVEAECGATFRAYLDCQGLADD